MPDQNDQTPSSPQSLVDAALGTPAPISPVTPPPLAPLAPPASSTTTTVTQTGATPTVTMGDDTPLAFASMPGSTTTTTTFQTTPVSSMESSYIPPVPGVAPAPTGVAPAPEKKKSKMGKILAVFFGFLMLGGAAFGGYTYYINNYGEQATIALITEKDKCTGCSKPENGSWLVWRNGQCKVSGTCNATNPNQNNPNPNPDKTEKGPGNCTRATASTCCGAGYSYCGGAINQCVTFAALSAAGGGCNKYGEVVYGIAIVYGANYKPAVNGTCAKGSGFEKGCNCGGTAVCFDKPGICDQDDATKQGALGTNYNSIGLCAVAGNYKGNVFTLENNTAEYTCTDSSCTAKGSGCISIRYTCGGTVPGYSCTDSINHPTFQTKTSVAQVGTATTFSNKCGTVEQIDVSCGDGGSPPKLAYVTSRTKINPPCTKTTTTTTTTTETPTMSCTGLTSVPALTPAPVIGAKLTFTCAGVVTPATAGTLTYKFRYSINSGAVTPLANKTPTTAELTIAACGTYSVECRACATLAGVVTCDPIWTGATQ